MPKIASKYYAMVFCFFTCNIYCTDSEYTAYKTLDDYVIWPDGIIHYSINDTHFDAKQKYFITKTIAYFEFNTCLKFVETLNVDKQQTLVIQNPTRRISCHIENIETLLLDDTNKIAIILNIGYDCLSSPHLEMFIMKILGLPYEHKRATRDIYINVHKENIIPDYFHYFDKEYTFPYELNILPYDINSVLHFDPLDYSNNGKNTFTIKKTNIKQNRIGLTKTDISKIDIVYRSHCRRRDSALKKTICSYYSDNFNRLKRETDVSKNLRTYINVSPPSIKTSTVTSHFNAPYCNRTTNPFPKSIETLEIKNQTLIVVDDVYQLTSTALRNAYYSYCNNTLQRNSNRVIDVMNIVEEISKYSDSYLHHATQYTDFCRESRDLEKYQWCCRFSFDHRCF